MRFTVILCVRRACVKVFELVRVHARVRACVIDGDY